MKDEWAENRLADFNLWVSGIGASARGRASLDSRLALRPEVREVIVNLLRLLAGVVDECKRLGQPEAPSPSRQLLTHAWDLTAVVENADLPSEPGLDEDHHGSPVTTSPEEPTTRSFSPWSDESASDGRSEKGLEPLSSGDQLHENMQNIEMMLDQLARIAVAVRKSGRRSRLQKADRRFKPEEHEDLQKHLTIILLARPQVLEEQMDPSKLSEVQQRLIRCNLIRRNRFLYAQQHSKGLHPDTSAHPSEAQVIQTIATRPAADGELTKEEQKPLPLIAKSSSEAVNAPINPTIRTGTSASRVSDSLALPRAPMPAPAASTIMSSTVINVKYPHPPKKRKECWFLSVLVAANHFP